MDFAQFSPICICQSPSTLYEGTTLSRYRCSTTLSSFPPPKKTGFILEMNTPPFVEEGAIPAPTVWRPFWVFLYTYAYFFPTLPV